MILIVIQCEQKFFAIHRRISGTKKALATKCSPGKGARYLIIKFLDTKQTNLYNMQFVTKIFNLKHSLTKWFPEMTICINIFGTIVVIKAQSHWRQIKVTRL